jgi:hypothetical protein
MTPSLYTAKLKTNRDGATAARNSVVVHGHCKGSPALCTSSSTASGGYRGLEMTMLKNRKRVIP